MKFKVGEEYPTRGGFRARVLATDLPGEYPVAAAIFRDNGWPAQSFTAEGFYLAAGEETPFDLIAPADEPEAPECPFKVGEEYQDSRGNLGRIVAIDAGDNLPVIWRQKVSPLAKSFRLDGTVPWSNYHLVPNAPKTKEISGWLKVYRAENGEYDVSGLFKTREDADDGEFETAVACIPITFEVPE